MITRRSLLGGGLLSGMMGSGSPSGASAEAAGQGGSDEERNRALQDIRRTLTDIRDDFRRDHPCTLSGCSAVDQIRTQQKAFVKSAAKFPDFIDVGIDVWESLWDWHIGHLQQPSVGRQPDGRYTMAFMLTTLVLRPDMVPSYISLGYDAK